MYCYKEFVSLRGLHFSISYIIECGRRMMSVNPSACISCFLDEMSDNQDRYSLQLQGPGNAMH